MLKIFKRKNKMKKLCFYTYDNSSYYGEVNLQNIMNMIIYKLRQIQNIKCTDMREHMHVCSNGELVLFYYSVLKYPESDEEQVREILNVARVLVTEKNLFEY